MNALLLSADGRRSVEDLARRHAVSVQAVEHLLQALGAGEGAMAQFSHPDFGGPGQWMRGGMTMVSDTSDPALRARVDALCTEAAGLLQVDGLFEPAVQGGSRWWPEGLESPAAHGSQAGLRYAYFPHLARLAIGDGCEVVVYDTTGHRLSGFGQQHDGSAGLVLQGQAGPVDPRGLPRVAMLSPAAGGSVAASPGTAGGDGKKSLAAAAMSPAAVARAPADPDEILSTIERLADLRGRGIISEEEFADKKADLLARL